MSVSGIRDLPVSTSVAVVGGGIVGLSVAFELARRGADVLVIERAHVGAGAAGVAAGMLAVAGEAEHETPELAGLSLESQRLYPGFVQAAEQVSGVPCRLQQDGTLLVALDRDDEGELERLHRFQVRLELPCTWMNGDEAREKEPQLSPRVTAALLAPADHQIDPRALLAALEGAVRALNGRVCTGGAVTGFETEGGRLTGVTGRTFAVRCEAAVLAAGAWSGTDIVSPGHPVPVRPVKGQLVRLRGPALLRRVIRAPEVYLVPRADGELIVGATVEEQGFDPTPTAGAVMDLLWRARLVVPAVYDLALAEVNVGFRPATRDHLPLIGPSDVPGLYLATGHFRHGVLLAPATAVLLANLILEGRASPLLAPFSPERLWRAPTEGVSAHG